MSQVTALIRDILRFHKLKIASIFLFATIFTLLIFPYDDLGNLLTRTIYDGSQQALYVHARGLDLGLLPLPGIEATDVTIEPGPRGGRFAPLHLSELEIRPLLSSLLAFRGGASTSGSGLFGGEFSAAAGMTTSFWASAPGPIEITGFSLEGVSLASVLDYMSQMSGQSLDPTLKVGGKLAAESDLLRFDPTYKEPLKGDLALIISGLVLPTSIPVPGFGGNLDIPQITLAKAEFRTVLDNGKVKITTGSFGTEKDPLSGRILGEFELRPIPGGGMSMGAFGLCIELNIAQKFYDNLLKQYAFLEGFKGVTEKFRMTGSGVRYGIKASGFDMMNFSQWQTQPGDCKNMVATP